LKCARGTRRSIVVNGRFLSWRAFLVVAMVLGLVVNPGLALADSTSPTVVSPDAAQAVTGHTYGEWSATWWQYVLSFPTSSNPLLDTTGAGCQAGQSGPVFFLVGSLVGKVVRDQCQVPSGKYLLLPLVNEVDVNTTTQTADELYREIAPSMDAATALHAQVDGVAVPITKSTYRTIAPAFPLKLTGNNLFGLAPGTYSPAVADGYYLMLAPLSPGPHTISYGGTGGLGQNGFTQDITYHLTVTEQ
jgi:hypothetical protein